MSKDVSRRTFLKGAAAGAVGVAAAGFFGVGVTACKRSGRKGLYTPGTYSATATGIGQITVTMTFTENRITNVVVDTSNETEGIGKELGADFAKKLIKAQSSEIDVVSGATVTSNAIKKAAEACIAQAKGGAGGAGGNAAALKGYSSSAAWLGAAPVIAERDIAATIEADIVVVGGGHAGIQVALGAAQNGAAVSVIEKQTEDKFTVLGEDVGIWNSRFMQRTFGLEQYDVGEIVHEFIKRAAGRAKPELLRSYVANSGRMFDNAIDIVRKSRYADILDTSVLVCQKQKGVRHYPIECGGWKTWATTAQFMGPISHKVVQGIAAFSNLPKYSTALIDEARRLGANWYYGNSAIVLVQDNDGSVIGCIAQDANRRYIKYLARKGVAVTTGDFSTNSDMCWALLNEEMEWAERAGVEKDRFITPFARDGYGHRMCCWAGGMIEEAPRPTMNIGAGFSGPWGTTPHLLLNRDGKRFCNEASAQTIRGSMMRQPNGIFAFVTDRKWMQSVVAAGVEHGGPNYGRPVYYEEMEEDMSKVLGTGAAGYEVRGCMVAERNPATVYGANTLEELADYLGYKEAAKETFLASIRHYNELCYAKDDTDYGKDKNCMIPVDEAPFYGVARDVTATGSVGLVTLAGLVTDDNMNVLDKDGNRIKGLYVAGNTLGGRYGVGYSTPCAGNSIGMAQTHGYILGEHLASL